MWKLITISLLFVLVNQAALAAPSLVADPKTVYQGQTAEITLNGTDSYVWCSRSSSPVDSAWDSDLVFTPNGTVIAVKPTNTTKYSVLCQPFSVGANVILRVKVPYRTPSDSDSQIGTY